MVLILATALTAGALGGWTVQLVRLYTEAPILAFGSVGPQLQRLSVLLAAYWVVDVLLLLLTLRLGWLAGRELRSGRRKREAERLFEN
jgi:hypothetical protein